MALAAATALATARSLLVVAGCTATIYGFLVVAMRILSRRQLGQLTAVDLVTVLILGSAVETGMIHGNVTLPAAIVSASTLLAMNRLLTLGFLRSRRLSVLVNGGPLLLVHDGRLVHDHLRRAGMTEDDLAESLRARGFAGLDGVRTVVLETDGSISAIGDRPRRR